MILKARLASAAALAVVAINAVLMVLGCIQNTELGTESVLFSLSGIFTTAAFAVVGVVLVLKRPENLIGWLLIGAGTSASALFFQAYAFYALSANPGGNLPGGTIAAALNSAAFGPFVFVIFLLALTFPSGRLPSPRWHKLVWVSAFGWLLNTLQIALLPGPLDSPYEQYENPLGIKALDFLHDYSTLLFIPFLLLLFVAIGNLFVRFRSSRGEEREQFRWLALSACSLVVVLPVTAVLVRGEEAAKLLNVAVVFSFASLPVSIGIAVLKYNLYSIDRILNRTLVYGFVTALLALTYFGLVVGLQAVLDSVNSGSGLAVALTTLVVAALFFPVRQRVQAIVDRRFNRHAYDAARTLEAFSARLRQEIDLDSLRYELLSVVDETMEPAGVSLWLRR